MRPPGGVASFRLARTARIDQPRRREILESYAGGRQPTRAALRYLAFGMTEDDLDAEPRDDVEERLLRKEADALRKPLFRIPRWRRDPGLFLEEVATRMDEVLAGLDRSSQSLESILGRIDRGEGSLGKLTTDDALYDNVSSAAANLDEAAVEIRALLEDVRTKPKKYIKLSLF